MKAGGRQLKCRSPAAGKGDSGSFLPHPSPKDLQVRTAPEQQGPSSGQFREVGLIG
jgi:hypothetical protein